MTARENESPAGTSSRTSRAKSRTTGDTPEQPAPQTETTANTTFNPREHTERVDGREVLPLRWRLAWLRAVQPQAMTQTDLVSHDIAAGTAIVRASIRLPGGAEASGYGWGMRETDSGLSYLIEAENRALTRALASIGFGPEYSVEFDETLDHRNGQTTPDIETEATLVPEKQVAPTPVAEEGNHSAEQTPAPVAETHLATNHHEAEPVATPAAEPAPVAEHEEDEAEDESSAEEPSTPAVEVVNAAQMRDNRQEEVPPFLRPRPTSIMPPPAPQTEDEEDEEDSRPTPTMDDIRRMMPTANSFFNNRDRANNAAANVRARERTAGYTPSDADATPPPAREAQPAPRIAPLPPVQPPRQPDSNDIDMLLRPVTDQRLRMILRQIYTAARAKNISFDKVRVRAEKVYGVPIEDLEYEEAEAYRDYIQNYKGQSGGGQQGS